MAINPQAIAQQRQVLQPEIDIPAPIGGLNTRDNRGSMPLTDAIELENMRPTDNSVQSREGYTIQENDFTGQVESLMTYKSGSTSELIAAAGAKWHTIPSIALAGSAELETGLTNARWQFVNFNGFLLAVNGADNPRNYNGTTVASTSLTGDIATDSRITTVDGIHVHRQRVYLWDTATSDFYYGATSAISGDFTKFPLGVVSQSGGNLMIVNTISFDTGSGLDDQLAFILDTGEVLIYAGGDPGAAAEWVLKGRYTIPKPISVRSSAQFGGDIQVITKADTISLLQFIQAEGRQNKFSKLTGAIKSEASIHKAKFGWQAIYHADEDLLIFNVPNVDNSKYVQYAINTNTGAPWKISGFNGKVFAVWDDDLYFGANGVVYKAFDGQSDNGAAINLVAQQAYTTFDSSAQKQPIAFEVLMGSEGDLTIGHALGIDYGDVSKPQTTTSSSAGTEWDAGLWDTFEWAGSQNDTKLVRFSVSGTGLAFSSKITIDVTGQTVNWYRSSYAIIPLAGR